MKAKVKEALASAILVAWLLPGCITTEQARMQRTKGIEEEPWSQEVKEAVKAGRVKLGMTAKQVEIAWGKPGRINRTVTANGVREQWVYGTDLPRPLYIYLTNGEVSGWQNSGGSR